jgi:hypothetical protein
MEEDWPFDLRFEPPERSRELELTGCGLAEAEVRGLES